MKQTQFGAQGLFAETNCPGLAVFYETNPNWVRFFKLAPADGKLYHELNIVNDLLIDWSTCPGIEVDPKRQSGAAVFAGTRVPVSVVLNNIHHGGTPQEIEEILENFPVTREQVELVLSRLERRPVLSSRS